jgi:predicted GNAT superfamily acetyltransferase
VSTRCLESLDELARVGPLFEKVWGATGFEVAMPVNFLRALVHSGNYVSGAFVDDELVGAAVGWLGQHHRALELHSHVVGVDRAWQSQGVGYQLKLHQKQWAEGRGIERITWTFDPLGRRNAWFNLVKLGARAVAYYANLYGVMEDELNGTDETDRCLISWDVGPGGRPGATGEPPPAAAPPPPTPPIMLAIAETGGPVLLDRNAPDRWEVAAVVCQVPADIVAVRQRHPDLARAWRLALRESMGRAMCAGFEVTGMTADGSYLLERRPS